VVIQYLADKMKGVPRDAFLRGLKAEGVPISAGYGHPVYRLPAFFENSFGKKGCPLTCGHYGKTVDYSKVRLPAVEHACYQEQMTIPQQYFMYRENVPRLVAAFRKVYGGLDALRADGAA